MPFIGAAPVIEYPVETPPAAFELVEIFGKQGKASNTKAEFEDTYPPVNGLPSKQIGNQKSI